MECSAQAGENADSIFKIIDTKKKPMDLSGEAESRNNYQKDDSEFVTSDVRFCNGDKESIRKKLIIKDVLQGNCQACKKKRLQKEQMATWCERYHDLITTIVDKFHKKKKII